MLDIQINNETIEKSLKLQFKTPKEISNYLNELITQDLEDKHFIEQIKQSNKKDFVSKDVIFKTLDSLA